MKDNAKRQKRTKHPTKPQTFLSLAAEYQLASDNESTALIDDDAVFLECACEMVSTMADCCENDASSISGNPKSVAIMLRGVRRFIEMTMSNISAVNHRLITARKSGAEPPALKNRHGKGRLP